MWIRNGVRVNQMKKHKKSGGDQFKRSLELCCISPSSVCIEKVFFERLGGFREDFEVCEDYDLWLRVTKDHLIGFIETPLIIKYGGHEDQLSRKLKAMDLYRIKSILFIMKNNLSIEQRKSCASTFLKKFTILEKGYKKHNRIEELSSLQLLLSEFESLI